LIHGTSAGTRRVPAPSHPAQRDTAKAISPESFIAKPQVGLLQAGGVSAAGAQRPQEPPSLADELQKSALERVDLKGFLGIDNLEIITETGRIHNQN